MNEERKIKLGIFDHEGEKYMPVVPLNIMIEDKPTCLAVRLVQKNDQWVLRSPAEVVMIVAEVSEEPPKDA